MQIIGHYSSPFVRRVAVAAQYLGTPLAHLNLSVFSEYDEFRQIQPLVKVPTLVCDDGSLLVDSTLIIDYLAAASSHPSILTPDDPDKLLESLQAIGVAIVANEKCAQITYETSQRPEALRHAPWLGRLNEQMVSALQQMEQMVSNVNPWMFGAKISLADITIATSWAFVTNIDAAAVDVTAYPALCAFSAAAEELPEFQACKS
jgi:glutathione S-transferase